MRVTKYTRRLSIQIQVLTFSHASIIRHFLVVNYFEESHSFAKHDVNIRLISNKYKVTSNRP